MKNSQIVRINLTEKEVKQLDDLCKKKERSKAYIITKAIQNYLNTPKQNEND